MRYLLDTNHLSAYCDAESVERRIDAAAKQGHRFGVTIPVLCEYRAGIAGGKRHKQNLSRLEKALVSFRTWPIDDRTTILFAEIATELRAIGRVLSSFDMLIAASARQLDLTLLTADRDFDAVSHLKVENWLI